MLLTRCANLLRVTMLWLLARFLIKILQFQFSDCEIKIPKVKFCENYNISASKTVSTAIITAITNTTSTTFIVRSLMFRSYTYTPLYLTRHLLSPSSKLTTTTTFKWFPLCISELNLSVFFVWNWNWV